MENAASPAASISSRAARAMSRCDSAVRRRGCLIGVIFPPPPQRYSVDNLCHHCRLLMMETSATTRTRWYSSCLWVLRVAVTLAAITYLFQAVSAGQFLDGDYAFLRLHQLGTTTADILMFIALVSAAGLRWVARRPVAPFLLALGAMVVSPARADAGAGRAGRAPVP